MNMDKASVEASRVAFNFAEGSIAGLRWAEPSKPRLLFCHANGFCASAYKQMLSRLSREFEVTAIDLRGHGRTSLPADAARLRDWRTYADDVRNLIEQLSSEDDRPIVVSGHSLGAVASLIAGDAAPRVVGAALLEPVAPPPIAMALWRLPIARPLVESSSLVKGARSRRTEWPDRAGALASYSRKPLFQNWTKGALEDYLEDGLTEIGGSVRLSCSPAWEAATFSAQTPAFWPSIRRRMTPTAVLAADCRDTTVPAVSRVLMRRSGVLISRIGGVGHLLPMEDPERAAAFIASFAAKWAAPR